MKRTLAALAAALALVLPGAGCASLAMTPLAASPYIGTRLDVQMIASGTGASFVPPLSGAYAPSFPRAPGEVALAAIDLPLSVAADTALLPFTLAASGLRTARSAEGPRVDVHEP